MSKLGSAQGLACILPILPGIGKGRRGVGLVRLLQSIEPGQLAYIWIPEELWIQLTEQRISEVCSLLAAHDFQLAVEMKVGPSTL